VITGHAQVVLGERAGGHQPDAARVTAQAPVQRVVSADAQQPGSTAGRRGLHHRGRGRDPRIGAAQVLLDLVQVLAEGGQGRGLLVGQAESGPQVLVDIGIDGDDRRTR
jgi:hypothetical protein